MAYLGWIPLIPEYVLRAVSRSRSSDADLATILVRRFGIPKQLATSIAIARAPSRAALLANKQFTQAQSLPTLTRVFRALRNEPDSRRNWTALRAQVVGLVPSLVLITIEYQIGEAVVIEAHLEDSFGRLADGLVDEAIGVERSSLRFFGFAPWQYVRLDAAIRVADYQRLQALPRESLNAVIQGNFGQPFKQLAAFLLALQVLTRRNGVSVYADFAQGAVNPASDPNSPAPITDIPSEPGEIIPEDDDCTQSNGCGPDVANLGSFVPDFNVGACCDAHDKCYCEGCKNCQRLVCDDAFYNCIRERGGVGNDALALVYYEMVRALGNLPSLNRYNNCGGETGVGGVIAAGAGIGIGVLIGVLAYYLSANVYVGVAMGAVIGSILAVVVTQFVSKVMCNICETVIDLLDYIREWEDEQISKEKRRMKRTKKRCQKKKSWWGRFVCSVKAIVEYYTKVILIRVVTILVEISLIPVARLVC